MLMCPAADRSGSVTRPLVQQPSKHHGRDIRIVVPVNIHAMNFTTLPPIVTEGDAQMPKPTIPGKKHQRCGALMRHRHGFCVLRPVPGKRRRRFHGGRSTGPRTPEGKARSAAARSAGLERWREEMRAKIAAGQATKFPGGRKPGAQWVTQRMWERKVLAEQQELRRQLDPPWPFRQGRGRRKDLEKLQLMFIERLRDGRAPLPPDEVKMWRDLISQGESMLGNPQGRDARLARIQWEIDRYLRRMSVDATIEALAKERRRQGASPGPPAQQLPQAPAMDEFVKHLAAERAAVAPAAPPNEQRN
jgi:hypothetical protein